MPGNPRQTFFCRFPASGEPPEVEMSDPIRTAVEEPITDAPERALVQDAWQQRWSLARLEREYILVVLNEMAGHRGRTAEILGIDLRTLHRKLRAPGAEGTRQVRKAAATASELLETAGV